VANQEEMKMAEADVDLILSRQKEFENERQGWESHWQQIASYMVPRRAEFTTTQSRGGKRRGDIYDSTAIKANNILAAGMHGQLTSPATPWFSLRTTDPGLMKKEEVRRWLHGVEQVIIDMLNGSNFNSAIHEDYLDLGPFGTSCLYAEKHPTKYVNFNCRPLTEIYIGQNAHEIVDIVHRKFTLRARQAYELWGDKAGEIVRKALGNKDFEKEIEFLHAVFPRDSFDPEKLDKINMPFASVYIEMEKKEKVSEGGYMMMPYFVDRWLKSSSEVYGRGPGIEVLPDVKMVNAMAKTILRAGQKMVDPPIVVPHGGFILPMRTSPSSLLFRTSMGNPNDKLEPLEVRGNIPIGLDLKEAHRKQIREAFFVDLFLMLTEKPKMTATEVLERVEEKMIVLGPVIGRLMNELLDPMIQWNFMVAVERQLVEPIPDILRDVEYQIEYVSPLARAQKMYQLNAVKKWVEIIGPLAEVQPEMLDWVDGDGAVTFFGDLLGVAPEVRSTQKVVEEKRMMRAKQQQQQKVMEELMGVSEILNKSGKGLKDLIPALGGEGGRT
jgi:hypothetical protein